MGYDVGAGKCGRAPGASRLERVAGSGAVASVGPKFESPGSHRLPHRGTDVFHASVPAGAGTSVLPYVPKVLR